MQVLSIEVGSWGIHTPQFIYETLIGVDVDY